MKDKYTLSISVLKEFKIIYQNEDLTQKLSTKACALLCYLAMQNEARFSRDRLATLFWENAEPETARYNLRFTVWRMKKILEEELQLPELLLSDKGGYMLNPTVVLTSDAEELRQMYNNLHSTQITEATFDRLKSIYRSNFLEGYSMRGSFKFNDWIYYEQEDLQQLYFKILDQLAFQYEQQQLYHKLAEVYLEMLKFNPYLENVHVSLIRTYIKQGNRSKALHQYKKCCTILRDELNVQPLETTKAVYKEITSGELSDESHYSFNENTNTCRTSHTDGINFLRLYLYHNETAFDKVLFSGIVSETLSVNCRSSLDIEYYTIWKLVDGLTKVYSPDQIRQISWIHWKDIASINGCVYDYFNESNSNQSVEKIKLFSSLMHILSALTKMKPLQIFIRDFVSMDRQSKDFFQFFLENNSDSSLALHIFFSEATNEYDVIRSVNYTNRHVSITDITS